MRKLVVGMALVLALGAAACGKDDGSDTTADGKPTAAGSGESESGGGYEPVSDVTSHGAIGQDVARVKDALAPAKEGSPVDWAEVEAAFEEGGASVKGDGSVRTLATLVDAPGDVSFVREAIAGTGASAGASDAVRAQRVEKGISVLLARKVTDELAAAGVKLADGDTDPDEGAPHNVDEAWAFFDAEGNGLAATADKRAADFEREGEVREPIEAALTAAQQAAVDGDEAAFEEAVAEVEGGVAYVFYLATHKYLDTEGDDVRRAEGLSFYRVIQPVVRDASAEADAAIAAAFEADDAESGRAALHRPEVLSALDVTDEERVDR